MEAEDDMEDEMMNKRDLDAISLEGIFVADDNCVIELGAIVVIYSQTQTKGFARHDNKPFSPFL